MGNTGGKKGLRQKVLEQQPYCIYCGGETLATTVDHMPPKIIFNQKRRPKGLEFSSCLECNKGSASCEQVVGLVCRMFSTLSGASTMKEIRKIMKAVNRNHPGLFEEIKPCQNQWLQIKEIQSQKPEVGGVFNCEGPILNEAMRKFGVKLGLAFHYHYTGSIVPKEGGVYVKWYSNESLFRDELPNDLISIVGNPETLRQGEFCVPDQFKYAAFLNEDKKVSIYWATFRLSFALAIFVAVDRNLLPIPSTKKVYSPGLF